MIVMCHKPAQIINTARMEQLIMEQIYKNFNEIYKWEHKFYEIVNDLNSNYYNCTDGRSDELRFGCKGWNPLTDKNMNKKTCTLNKNGRDDLNNLFKNNQKLRDKIKNFVGNKAGFINDQIIDKRYKYITLNTMGKENLNKFVQSKDRTRFLFEILASYR